MDRIEGLAGVDAVGAINPLPLNFESYSQDYRIEAADTGRLMAGAFWATPGYFDAAGMPVVRGRSFTNQDRSGAPKVVIVNRQMAEQHFPDQDSIGQTIYLNEGKDTFRPATIVGLVENSKSFLLNEDTSAQIYMPQLQDPSRRRFLIIRTSGDPLGITSAVRSEIARIDPLMPLTTIRSMDQVVAESMQLWSGPAAAFGGLGIAALLLSMMGIYGVISFFVGQRQREIGIHLALGAARRDILKIVVGEGVLLTGMGVGLGLAGAIALGRLIQSLLYGTSSLDPRVLAATTLLLITAALLACYLPARRAARVDPMVALRHE
jgi:putative ABC transport system permease protein